MHFADALTRSGSRTQLEQLFQSGPCRSSDQIVEMEPSEKTEKQNKKHRDNTGTRRPRSAGASRKTGNTRNVQQTKETSGQVGRPTEKRGNWGKQETNSTQTDRQTHTRNMWPRGGRKQPKNLGNMNKWKNKGYHIKKHGKGGGPVGKHGKRGIHSKTTRRVWPRGRGYPKNMKNGEHRHGQLFFLFLLFPVASPTVAWPDFSCVFALLRVSLFFCGRVLLCFYQLSCFLAALPLLLAPIPVFFC